MTLYTYAVHPSVFDCTLQAMSATLSTGVRGGLLPIGMDRIFFHSRATSDNTTFWAKAAITRDEGNQVCLDRYKYFFECNVNDCF